MSNFHVITPGPDRVGESPVWDDRQQVLWWVGTMVMDMSKGLNLGGLSCLS